MAELPDIDVPRRIETDRLVLRPYVPSDAEALFAAVDGSRDTLEFWLPWVASYKSVDDAVRSIERFEARWDALDDLPLGIFERRAGDLLGGTGLHKIDWDAGSIEIGYWLAEAHEGNGYVTEAVRALVEVAFERLDARRIEIRMDPHNVRSRGIPTRLGFTYEGVDPDSFMGFSGPPRDTDVYVMER